MIIRATSLGGLTQSHITFRPASKEDFAANSPLDARQKRDEFFKEEAEAIMHILVNRVPLPLMRELTSLLAQYETAPADEKARMRIKFHESAERRSL